MLCLLLSTLWATFLAVCAHSDLFLPIGHYPVDANLARRLRQQVAYVDLGNTLSSSPDCLTRNGRKAHCFFVTEDGSVGYASVVDGVATFRDFGGSVVNQPQTVGYGKSGVFAMFMTSTQELAVAAVKTDTEFDETVTVLHLGEFLEAPGCATLEERDELFCVARATNGSMYSFKFADGTWGDGAYVADNPSGPVSCLFNAVSNRIQCWANDKESHVAERLFMVTGAPDSRVWMGLGLRGKGRIDVHKLGFALHPRTLSYSDQQMVDVFKRFGGRLTSEPDCASAKPRPLDCFALDEDDGLQRDYQLTGPMFVRKTSGWVHYGGRFVGKPSCIFMSDDDKLHCYMRSAADTLVEGRFKPLRNRGVVAVV